MTEGRKSSGFSVDSNVFLTIVRGGFRLRKPGVQGQQRGERGTDLQYKHIRVYLIKSYMSGSLNGVFMMRLTSDGQPWASCDKLQKESLLLGIEAAQHLKQEPNCTAAKTG